MTLYIVVLVLNVLLAVACGNIAESKHRSRQAWFLSGVFLGPLPLAVLLLLPASRKGGSLGSMSAG